MRVLDAAYRLDRPEDEWLSGVANELCAAFDHGEGVHCFALDLRTGKPSSPTLIGGDAEWTKNWRREWWEKFILRMDAEMFRGLASFGPLSYTSDLFAATARAMPTFELFLTNQGAIAENRGSPPRVGKYPDSLNLIASSPTGEAIVFTGNRSEIALGPPSASSVDIAGLIAAHLSAAIRLRHSRAPSSNVTDSADVVLTESGAIVNVRVGAALDSSLETLSHAARTVVRAKKESDGEADGRASLLLWQVLFSKSFTVHDAYEKDGRRYLVANRNRPVPNDAFASKLTQREREVVALLAFGHSNKLIGYELDVSESSVASYLRAIARKLGVDGVAGIIASARSQVRAETKVQ